MLKLSKNRRSAPQVRFPGQSHHRRKWVFKFTLSILFLCLLIWCWQKLHDPKLFPIQHINIQGNFTHIDQSSVKQVIIPFLQKGFIIVNTNDLQERLQQIPWVYTANVRRVWPDTLNISIAEQQPVARFNDAELLNVQGELFSVKSNVIPINLPLFIGAQGEQEIMLQTYQNMLSVLTPLGLKINILGLDDRQSWRLQLSNGIVLLIGKVDPILRLQRFVAAYPQVVGTKSAMVNYIDLRYAHGMVVKFKTS